MQMIVIEFLTEIFFSCSQKRSLISVSLVEYNFVKIIYSIYNVLKGKYGAGNYNNAKHFQGILRTSTEMR